MARQAYIEKRFGKASTELIEVANSIIEEYALDGYDLTVRQLYYQFVARGLIENTARSYKRLGTIINDGRLAGLVDWEAIVDRTRNLESRPHWDSPESIVRVCADSYARDKWNGQPYRVEVWIEKEALAGVLENCCPPLDVDYFSCRGYVSQSEQWRAAMRLRSYSAGGQQPYIIHLGDHDPSGIDMTRDIADRLRTFGCNAEVDRIALNMDQVEEFQPPPNPAKMTDSRFQTYADEHGRESWELDALEPRMLARIITEKVLSLRDQALWDAAVDREEKEKRVLADISDRYGEIVEYLDDES